MVHILGVQLFENNFVKVCCQSFFLFGVPLIRFLACVDPFLRNKSSHGQSHLRSPPDPRHLPRSPALRNANNIHRRLSLITIHVAYPPAWSSRVPRIPTTTSINAPPEPARSTHIPCAARRSSPATPTGQNQGRGPTPLAEDRDGLETRDTGEYCSSTHDRQLHRQETCDGSAGTRAEHSDERKDGKKTQQSRTVSVVFRCQSYVFAGKNIVRCGIHRIHIYLTNCTPYRVTP